ncbi:peptidoglycan-binding protein [Actinomadura alba]|uniref:Peptidoglycan-binding protein n=1 Tax=Actinomadura alba TaxID=406431 RepID=A0ABR7LYD7_9ACTN|nr:peptidoglycan-binding domain-containing protein [Actinomadura alba]MBC6469698.1 peptidoglycan-binding protein [Actinomadura alba]
MRAGVVPAAIAVVLAAGGVGAWQVTRPRPAADENAPRVAVTSAVVSRGDIVARVQLPGVLEFDGTYSIANQLPPGVVTSVARTGSVLARGSRLFTVGATPAVLMYGSRPAYRDFAAGMTDGGDVRDLERNLAALGMDPGRAMTVDRHFSAATAAAIRRWQKARGLPLAARTGRLALGEVVFLPGRIRVKSAETTSGSSAGPGARMLAATSTNQVVRVTLSTDQRSQVHVGDRVEVTLTGVPRGVQGRVRSVGTVATAPTQAGGGGGDGPNAQGPATVPVTIVLIRPGKAFAGLDLAPVQVAVAGSRRQGVLTIPITALLARPGGGYQVALLEGTSRRLLPVRPGLYDQDTGTVEVTGAGVREGARVEVPVS